MSELFQLQKAFTEHLRNPDAVPVPAGLDPRRVGIYTELVFNNLQSLLSDFFPTVKGILPKERWRQLVRDFLISHQAETPYFPKLSEEFVHYLSGRQNIGDDPGFLLELAHYEWINVHLFTHQSEVPDKPVPEQDLCTVPIQLSAVAEPLAYAYPVHQIQPDSQPGEQPTLLLVFRDPDESVRFFELQPFTFQFMDSLHDNSGMVAGHWLADMADQMAPRNPEAFIESGVAMLQRFNKQCVFETSRQ